MQEMYTSYRKSRILADEYHAQGLRWTKAEVGEHMFPRLRLQQRRSLVSLAGGTEQLPLTDSSARATPLAPAQWREMLQGAVSNPAVIDPAVPNPAAAEGADASGGAHTGCSMGKAAAARHLRDGDSAGAVFGDESAAAGLWPSASPPSEPRSNKKAPPDGRSATFDYGYKSRPGLGPDGAPASSGTAAPAWRSLGRDVRPRTPDPAAGGGVRAALGDVVVLDVRNGYEWDAGHFSGAERPSEVPSIPNP